MTSRTNNGQPTSGDDVVRDFGSGGRPSFVKSLRYLGTGKDGMGIGQGLKSGMDSLAMGIAFTGACRVVSSIISKQ